ncbi:sigma-70 family RNA polymerase sigma factor [Nocardioides koreensis]|uniref:sigma-70 family RNA polymerase sigma factor n=1 Tax=Nocardioides koreensis TaxID=433651 RepID=UPI0031D5D0FE
MSTTAPTIEGPADAELISAVRGGDVDAYGELFQRHVTAARRLAHQLVSGPDVDDLVSEAFAKVMVVLQRGGGPDLAFRAYLLTAVRRLHVDRIRATARLHTTDDLTPFDPGIPFRDTAVEGFENAAAARAFASLPERWQLVLWHTEVEGQKPAEVAPLLGLSANSVSALAYRAREGLRQAFLSMHAQDTVDASCTWTQEHLGSYVRHGLSRRDATRVEGHLRECRRCMAVYLELDEVNSGLAGLLAPLLLGGAAAGYVASAGGSAAAGGLLALLGRARDVALANAPTTAVAGVAAAVVAAGTLLHPFDGPSPGPQAEAPVVSTTGPERGPREPGGPEGRDAAPGGRRTTHPGGPPPSAAAPPVAPAAAESSPPSPSAAPPDHQQSGSQPTDPGPTEDGADGDGPAGDGAATPDQPAGMDLAVSAAASPSAGVAFEVRVTVTGLDPGRTATLGVTADHTSVTLTPDTRCAGLGIGHGSCAVTDTPTTYTFVVAAPPDAPTTLTFTVRPDGQVLESDPSDNTTRVQLVP